MNGIKVIYLVVLCFFSVAVIHASEVQECKIIAIANGAYSIPPPPYSSDQIYIERVDITYTIRHRDGSMTQKKGIFEGWISVTHETTLQEVIDKAVNYFYEAISIDMKDNCHPENVQ